MNVESVCKIVLKVDHLLHLRKFLLKVQSKVNILYYLEHKATIDHCTDTGWDPSPL